MNKISSKQTRELFLYTLDHLNEKYVNSDEELEYHILEELDIDARSFLHGSTINVLVEEDFIPASLSKDIYCLRNLILELLENKREIDQIRFDEDWKIARQSAEEILKKVHSYEC